MISIVVCSRLGPYSDLHERHVHRTVGTDHEYVRINNADNIHSLCSAYNEGVRRSQGNILVFVHEDVFFMELDWGPVLEVKFANDPGLGLIGVAGTQYLASHHPAWLTAGQPFIRGHVVHETAGGENYHMAVFSPDKTDAQVVAVDGLFFAVRADLFKHIRFDEQTFDGFHFYDLDICMQINKSHKLIVTWDILVKHLSEGTCDQAWQEAGQRFLSKYQDDLPVSCVDAVPQFDRPVGPITYNLKGVLPQGIIG
jgi:hypothetical protein